MSKSLLLWTALSSRWTIRHSTLQYRKNILSQMWRYFLSTIQISRQYPSMLFILRFSYCSKFMHNFQLSVLSSGTVSEISSRSSWHSMFHFVMLSLTSIDMDGAYFGTTFPHLYLMTYGHLKPQKPVQSYVPRVFGFKLHKPWRMFRHHMQLKLLLG